MTKAPASRGYRESPTWRQLRIKMSGFLALLGHNIFIHGLEQDILEDYKLYDSHALPSLVEKK